MKVCLLLKFEISTWSFMIPSQDLKDLKAIVQVSCRVRKVLF